MATKGGRIDFMFLGPPLPGRWIRYCAQEFAHKSAKRVHPRSKRNVTEMKIAKYFKYLMKKYLNTQLLFLEDG